MTQIFDPPPCTCGGFLVCEYANRSDVLAGGCPYLHGAEEDE